MVDDSQTLVLAFGAPSLSSDTGWRETLRTRFEKGVVVGCSTPGEILGSRLFDHAVTVAVLRFAHSTVRAATVELDEDSSPEELGHKLAAELHADDLQAILVFADGPRFHGAGLIQGIRSQVLPSVQLSGGMAAAGGRLGSSWVLSEGACHQHRATAVGLYGDQLRTGQGCEGGWIPFGPERQIIRADSNLLFELDDGPALDHCRVYLGEFADELRTEAWKYPVAIRPNGSSHGRVRAIVDLDEQQHSLVCNEEIPPDSHVQLLRAHPDDLIDGAAAAATQATVHADAGNPTFALGVSGAVRRQILGSEAEDELAAMTDVLPDGAQLIGFYAHGELACLGDEAALQHQTMVLTTIWEEGSCTGS